MEKQRSKKILVNVVVPLIAGINKKVEDACLHRDAYLDAVFLHEAKQLAEEMPVANSDDAKAELTRHLKMLDTKPVNFSLSEETVQAINDACQRMRVPRDCFINRVLLFLSAKKPTFFDLVLGIDVKWYWHERVIGSGLFEPPYFLDGSLEVIRDVIADDPFGHIRACIEAANDHGESCDPLHRALLIRDFLPKTFKSALGFNCYLPDSWIEGHPAEQLAKEELESWIAAWDEEVKGKAAEKGIKKGKHS